MCKILMPHYLSEKMADQKTFKRKNKKEENPPGIKPKIETEEKTKEYTLDVDTFLRSETQLDLIIWASYNGRKLE